jgi:hypothetical protein
MSLYTYFKLKYILKNHIAYIWNSKESLLINAGKLESIPLRLLIGIDRQKKSLLDNTKNFALGNFTNNALLWGSRGNGKSTLIKSIFNELSVQYSNIRLIQLNKNDIHDISHLYSLLNKFNNYHYVIFIDDLSFDIIDTDYKKIKSTLDGSLQKQPSNIILYVTSNRRHLMARDIIDNERSSAIHTDEGVDEKISLSDRFGLWIGFHNISQNEYLNIITSYCKYFKIELLQNDLKKSIQWSLQRGNRNGRTAWQFVIQLAAERNLKIYF